jgi:hypothetical protein
MRKVLSRKTALAAGVAGVVGVAVTLATSGTAQAAPANVPGEFVVCASAHYTIEIEFPERGNESIIPAISQDGRDNCVSADIGDSQPFYIIEDQGYYLGQNTYNSATGTTVVDVDETHWYVY